MLNCDVSDKIVVVLYFIFRCLRTWMVFAIDSIQVSKVVILRCSFKGKFLFNFEAFVTELVLASSLSLEVFSAS